MKPIEENIYVFAARYAHGRNTGAALMVVKQLISEWSKFSRETKRKIIEESHEARHCHEDWKMLRDYTEYGLDYRCAHDYDTPIHKGMAHYRCRKCGRDISSFVVLMHEAKTKGESR